MARQSKGLTEHVLLRMSPHEKAMVDTVRTFYGDELDSTNSAIRQCIWDGYDKARAQGAPAVTNGDSSPIDGQTALDISQDGKETK